MHCYYYYSSCLDKNIIKPGQGIPRTSTRLWEFQNKIFSFLLCHSSSSLSPIKRTLWACLSVCLSVGRSGLFTLPRCFVITWISHKTKENRDRSYMHRNLLFVGDVVDHHSSQLFSAFNLWLTKGIFPIIKINYPFKCMSSSNAPFDSYSFRQFDCANVL